MGNESCYTCSTPMETKDIKRCGNCKMAFYCSKACQKVHWKAGHKAVCPNNVVVNQKHGETPEQKAYWKKIRRYMNTWTHAITYCLPVALDLANYEWGRHETHVLLLLVEHTGLEADHELYRVKDAMIKLYADMVKVTPDLKDATADPPGPGLSRLRCFFFFTYSENPELLHTRSRTWWMQNLREAYYGMDKEYSRVNSELAIPRLVTEMNILRDPQGAVERFRAIASGPGFSVTSTEEAENDNQEPLLA